MVSLYNRGNILLYNLLCNLAMSSSALLASSSLSCGGRAGPSCGAVIVLLPAELPASTYGELVTYAVQHQPTGG